jgi:hypothetical protein
MSSIEHQGFAKDLGARTHFVAPAALRVDYEVVILKLSARDLSKIMSHVNSCDLHRQTTTTLLLSLPLFFLTLPLPLQPAVSPRDLF